MTKLLLARHGHVQGIHPERFRGREPLELTVRGRAEAAALAKRVASGWRPARIYTSPLGRCIATGAAIAESRGIHAEICEDLNDIDYGAWTFKTFDHAKEDNPALFAAWFATPHLVRFPGGESLQDLAARAANVLRFVLARHADDAIVLVGHDSMNRVLLLQCLDLPLSSYQRIAQSPCCLNEIDLGVGGICVRRINETGYLDAIAASE
ncbi:MAG: histidine phosphatase family protein [Xanthobacteraceae bacterium]